MWALIMILVTSHGVAVDHLSGFKSARSCVAAGKQWADAAGDIAAEVTGGHQPSISCVRVR